VYGLSRLAGIPVVLVKEAAGNAAAPAPAPAGAAMVDTGVETIRAAVKADVAVAAGDEEDDDDEDEEDDEEDEDDEDEEDEFW
jgi:hypothetical protein